MNGTNTLDPRTRHLLEQILFEGKTCSALARSIGRPASEVRDQIATAIIDATAGVTHDDAMSALRLLDTLDPDAPFAADPARGANRLDALAVVAAWCSGPPIRPSPHVLEMLHLSIEDERFN